MLKNIIKILPFFMVTLLSIGGVELLYGVLEHYLFLPTGKKTIQKSVISPSDKPAVVLEKHKNYQVILDRNLFKSFITEPVKPAETGKNPLAGLEATSLDLVLMGTISGPEDRSRVIIMEKAKRKQDIYYKGDVVQGAQIKEILRGKVILTFQGKDEVLDMAEAKKYKPRQSAAVAPRPPKARTISRPQVRPRRMPAPARIKTRTLPKPRSPVEDEVDDIEDPESEIEEDTEIDPPPVDDPEGLENSNGDDIPPQT